MNKETRMLVIGLGVLAVLCTVIYLVTRSHHPCGGDPCKPPTPTITFGCRASIHTWGGFEQGKNDQLSSHTASVKSDAREEALRWYLENNPGIAKYDANCWSCTQPNLGPAEREVCGMKTAGFGKTP